MKQSNILSIVVVAVATLVSASTTVFAQSQNIDIQTSLPSQVSSSNMLVMSPAQVETTTRTAVSLSLRAQSSQFATMTAKMILPTIASSLDAIQNGGSKTYTALVGATASHSIVNQNNLQVHLSYEPRPIGGILNIRVELVPQFSGVGVATRAIASKTMVTAVDGLNSVKVNKLVAALSADLASDFAGTNMH